MLTGVSQILGKVLSHTCLTKAFVKIAKLRLGKYCIGCVCPICFLLSAACDSHSDQNCIVKFCNQSTRWRLLLNKNKITELLSLQRMAFIFDFESIRVVKTTMLVSTYGLWELVS